MNNFLEPENKIYPDTQFLLEQCNNNVNLFKKMICIIKHEFFLDKEKYFKEVGNQRYKNAAKQVHKMNSTILLLGYDEAFGLLVEYENDLQKNELAKRKNYEDFLTEVSKYINQIYKQEYEMYNY